MFAVLEVLAENIRVIRRVGENDVQQVFYRFINISRNVVRSVLVVNSKQKVQG